MATMEESKLQTGYLVTPRVPQGLAAAVEGLTREVIRHSPEDIYVFAARHFEKLLLVRERCGGVVAEDQESSSSPTARDVKTLRTLREMSQALRTREVDHENRGNARTVVNSSDQAGWSLNETARVLKRHRSIFGEAGRRISTDEVFRMAGRKDSRSRGPKQLTERDGSRENVRRNEDRLIEETWRTSSVGRTNERSSRSNEEAQKSGPRIITRIPNLQSSHSLLAKDIKSELRKNRISSRERRNVRAKPEDRTDSKSGPKAARKTSDRPKRPETEAERRNRRSVDAARSSEGQQATLDSRAPSMDKVKDYVVQRFAATKSLEELQTLNYVEKVQEIIDETGPIIKGKVDQLKSGMIGTSKRSSWFAEPRSDEPRDRNASGDRTEEPVFEYSPKSRDDALKTRLTETRNLLENVSSKMTRPRRSRSARSSRRSPNAGEEPQLLFRVSGAEVSSAMETSSRDNGLERRLSKTRNLLEDISSALSRPMRRSSSAKNLRRRDDEDSGDLGSKDALKSRLDETRDLLEGISASFGMPRAGSAKGRRGRANGCPYAEDATFSDSLNTPKVSLPAVRSASAKSSSGSVSRSDSDNLVLPSISPEAPKTRKTREDLVLPALSPPATGSSNEAVKIEEIDAFADVDIPEMPVDDVVPEVVVEDVFRDSLNVTPDFDSVPQRPDSLEPPETADDIDDDSPKVDDLQGRLREIQRVEKDIEKVFARKTEGLEDAGVKKKLQELEEAEMRIERILDSEGQQGDEDSPGSETKADSPMAEVGGLGEAGSVEEEMESGRAADEGEVNGGKDEETKENDRGTLNVSSVSPEALTYTYVLTEGSPNEIPDTVTTVIIPERTVESPVSDRPHVDKGLEVVEEIEEKEPEDVVITTAVDSKTSEVKTLKYESLSNDPFGEVVEPEPVDSTSPDLDYICGVNGRQEVNLSHQDLARITEEIAEEFEEGPEKSDDVGKVTESIEEAAEEANDEGRQQVTINPDSPAAEEEMKDDEDEKEKEITSPGGPVAKEDKQDEGRQQVTINPDSPAADEEKKDDEDEKAKEITSPGGPVAKEDNQGEGRQQVTINPDSPAAEEEKKDDEDEKAKEITSPGGPVAKEDNQDEGRQQVTINPDSPAAEEEMKDNEDEKTKEITSPGGPVAKEDKQDSEDGNVEANEITETPETPEAALESNKGDPDDVGVSPDGSTTKEENVDSEDGKEKVVESLDTPEATEAAGEPQNEDHEEDPSSPQGSMAEEMKKNNEDNKVEVIEATETPKTTETPSQPKEVDLEEATSSPDAPAIQVDEENPEERGTEVDKSKSRTESELSPEAARPYLDSESSNEAKESSGPEDNGESAKCPNSADDEDSSATRSPESSNEVKETTLTDGLSLSLDPTRPFVPELNLDSLQDITVSSFKMTEDEYDNQGPEDNQQSGNTNSITETLTSDENRRMMMENAEYVEEAIVEHLSSSSDRSKMEEATTGREEVAEEPIVKSQVEIKEDICVKGVAHITGSNSEEEKEEEEEDEKEDMAKSSPEDGKEAIPAAPEDEETDKAKGESSVELEKIDNQVAEDAGPEVAVRGPTDETSESKSASLEVKKEEEEVVKEDDSGSLEAGKSTSLEARKEEEIKEDDAKSPEASESVMSLEVKKEEEIKEKEEDDGITLEASITASLELNKEEEIKEDEHEDQTTKDPSSDVSDEMAEENFVEEETPLAVSRSASQCTTRRVSSGNLAKLREDPTLGWTEEIEDEIGNDDEASPSKLKLTKIGGLTIREQGSDEVDPGEDKVEPGHDKVEPGQDEVDPGLDKVEPGQDEDDSGEDKVELGHDKVETGQDEDDSGEDKVDPGQDEVDLGEDKVESGQDKVETGQDEVDPSEDKVEPGQDDSANPKNGSEDTRECLTGDSKEYHIYVPEVEAGEGSSTTESSTVDSAVTKIQARVRGFLTRRRLHRGQHNRSSTLGSIPSIQDSVAEEPSHIDGDHPESEQPGGKVEETFATSMTLDDPGLENAATRIQSNYRGYKARKRLRREDAVQRTTLSLEKSFADSGLQHTGEFHDCVPLPIHDVTLRKLLGDRKTTSTLEQPSSESSGTGEIGPEVRDPEDNDPQGHGVVQGRRDLDNMFFGQPNVPLIQFGLAPKIDHLVDLVILAKEEANLENSYLNFITSVEDAEPVVLPQPAARAEFADANSINESLKEPLALSAPPVGVVIEEVTSSDFEALANDPSAESAVAAPEVSTGSSGSPRAPCASSETISGSGTEESNPEAPGGQMTEETPEGQASSSRGDLDLAAERSTENFGVTETFSLPRELEMLGPESSVDSIECPLVGVKVKASSGSSGDAEELEVVGKIRDHPKVQIASDQGRDSSPGVEGVEDDVKEDEPFVSNVSNVDDASSTLSFSLKVEDVLGLGSEDSTEFQGRKPILEVTLTPGDILKSMSLSQESQLAGERIESPVTMVQMAPARSESLQLDDDEETVGKPSSPGSTKSESKNS